MKKIILLSLLLINISSANAFDPRFNLAAGVSTIGINVAGIMSINDKWSFELGGNKFYYTFKNLTLSDTEFDLKLDLESLHLFGNFHPFGGKFRITAGILYNNNSVKLPGIARNQFFTINGIQIPVNQIGTLNGKIAFNPIAAYLGIGWGHYHKKKGLGISLDLGVFYFGKAKFTLTGSNVQTQALLNLINNEITELNNQFSKHVVLYPMISIRLFYGFG